MTKPHRKNRSIRLDDEEWATLRDDLGIGWLRTQIEQAKARKAQSYLLEALIIAEEKLLIAEQYLDLGEDDSIEFEYAILTARAAIARARGAA